MVKECNIEKHECYDCDKQYIVGTELLKEKESMCPYCGSGVTDRLAWTDSKKLVELELGCLGLEYRDKKEF